MTRVYFIKPIGMQGPIKIGCSWSPDRRLSSLETWAPFPLEIIAEIGGDGRLERRFHAMFADLHLHHEWFNWSRQLQGVIDAIRANTFDIEGLPAARRITHRGRDNSYNTPAWRYSRSVQGRIHALGRRGLAWNDPERQEAWIAACKIKDDASLVQWRRHCEALMAKLQERYPTKSRLRRRAA